MALSPNTARWEQKEGHYGEDYLAWKNWSSSDSFGLCTHRDALYFAAEMKRTRLASIRNVLEIGFGNGSFLAYARSCGWQITGTEANPALLAAAASAGYPVLLPAALPGLSGSSFDLIVAFDVLEHIPSEELVPLLVDLRAKLKPEGVILARFPNGDSPFGLPNQNGDLTHAQTIGCTKLRYFATAAALEVAELGPEAFPVSAGDWQTTLYRAFARPIRSLIEGLIKVIYFPRSEVYFTSPNLVAVLRKPTA